MLRYGRRIQGGRGGIDRCRHLIQAIGGPGGLYVAADIGFLPGEFIRGDLKALKEQGIDQAGQHKEQQPQAERPGHQPKAGVTDADPESGGGQQSNGGQKEQRRHPGAYIGIGGPEHGPAAGIKQVENIDHMPPGQVDHQADAHYRKVGRYLGGYDKADAAQPVNRPIQGQGCADIDQALPEQPILEKVHHLQIDHIPADIQPEYGVSGVKGFQLEQEQHRLPVVIGIEPQGQAGGEHSYHKAGPQQEKEQPHKVQGDDAGGRALLGQAQGNQLVQADEKGGDGDAHREHPGLHHPHPGQGALVAQLPKPEPIGIEVDGPPEAEGGHHDQGQDGNPAAELIALVFGQARQRRPQRLLGVIGQVIAHSAVSFSLFRFPRRGG